MLYRRLVAQHLQSMPDPALLSRSEARMVGDDLAHYCRNLLDAQKAGITTAVSSLGMSGANLAAALFVPGAKLALLVAAFGLAGLSATRTYNLQRRQGIIKAIVADLDALSWRLKR